MSIIYK